MMYGVLGTVCGDETVMNMGCWRCIGSMYMGGRK